MRTIDLLRDGWPFTTTATTPELVSLPRAKYLTAGGRGGPEGLPFREAVSALYALASHIKGHRTRRGFADFRLGALEAQWWADEGPFQKKPRAKWRWKVLVRVPGFVTTEELVCARRLASEAGTTGRLAAVKLEWLAEGRCVQVLHVGPYSTESADLLAMQRTMAEHHLVPAGRHHELYLSDPERTRSSNLKTILRTPVKLARKRP